MVDGCKTACTFVEKGGVGKSTSAAHIAVAATQDHDLDVCLVDLAGTQNDLATQFGIADEIDDPEVPISAVFAEQWDIIVDGIPDIVDRMRFETGEGPDLIPSDQGVGSADNNLANEPLEERYDMLVEFIADHLAPEYDLVLLDLPGKEDNISINGLVAVEDVIAPVRPGQFEVTQLEALQDNLAEIGESHGRADPRLSMVIPTMIDRREGQSTRFVDDLKADYPDRVSTPIVRSANVGDCQERGHTLFAVSDDELYQTGREVREAYRETTTQLLETI